MTYLTLRRLAWGAALGAVASLGILGDARAQAPGLGAGGELVDPDVLRVCADPRNLPFSNEHGDGFENKIAALLGQKLGKPVAYAYFPQVIGFVRNTLNAYRCDVVMAVAVGDDLVQTTNPYYKTTYALVVKKGGGLEGITTLADPRLQGKHIGIVAGTPPATIMAENGLMAHAKPYPLTVDTRVDSPAKNMVDDIMSGEIDAGILWGPIAGYWATHEHMPLAVSPLLNEKGTRMEFSIAMGVRHSDQDWKRNLNKLIGANQDAINQILTDYGVPLLDGQGKPLTTP